MRELLPRDARAHAARVDELAYLANVVLAGCSTHGDELRATDAARATLEICDLGAASLFAKTRPAAFQMWIGYAVLLVCWMAGGLL